MKHDYDGQAKLMTQTTRRAFLQSSGAALSAAAFGCSSPQAPTEKRWNIVWIIADDLSADLGCYGDVSARTPNLDRLAGEGARYTNACVTAPVCSPSRSAFITGMYQTSIGAHHHRSHRNDGYVLPEPVRLITDYFRDAGYYTVNDHQSGLGGRNKTDYNFQLDHEPFDGTNWRDRGEGQPFYAQVNIREPHRDRPPEVWSSTADVEQKTDPAAVDLPSYYPDHPVARQDWTGYMDAIQILDEKVGRVLDRIDEDGLRDSTVVIFFGDHGRPMPRDKQFLYEGGIHVPLIIRWPGKIEPGSVRDELVSSIDLSATSLSVAGITPPDHMEGRVMIGPEAAPSPEYVFAARDRCDETVDRIRAVRSKRYKYIRNFMPERPYMQLNRYKETSYPTWRLLQRLHKLGELTPAQQLFLAKQRPEEELYDLENDPDEVNNLAASPEHAEILTRMASVLTLWIEHTGDQGETPEDPAIAEYWDARMIEAYEEVYPAIREREEPW